MGAELVVHAVKHVLLVAFRVHHLELRRIEEPAGVQPARGDVVAPLASAESDVEAASHRAKRTVGSRDAACWLSNTKTRARRDLDHQARFVAEFCGRRAGDDLE